MLCFEASSAARIGAWALLGFWLLFAGFWAYQGWTGPRGPALYGWSAVAAIGLVLQALRVAAIGRPLLVLGQGELHAQGLLGGLVRHELERVRSASLLRRRTRATLVLRFETSGPLRALRGRWLYPLDELNEPRAFVTELLARIPQARVDASVARYLAGEEESGPPERQVLTSRLEDPEP